MSRGAGGGAGQILVILFPMIWLVACGFKYSIAKMYGILIGLVLAAGGSASASPVGALSHLAPVTIGNILGVTILVSLV